MAILYPRRGRAIGLVYICDGGSLGNFTLPEGFTDRGPSPAAGPLTRDVLADLAKIVSSLRKELDKQDG